MRWVLELSNNRSVNTSHKIVRLLPLIAIMLLSGCPRSPHFDAQVLRLYKVGNTREEIQKGIGDQPMVLVVRPKEGWMAHRNTNRGADIAAAGFEKEKNVKVYRTEVYWIGRATSAPLAVGGVWWDYLFYDSNDRLLGFRGRFLD